jgi:hypothetical protein
LLLIAKQPVTVNPEHPKNLCFFMRKGKKKRHTPFTLRACIASSKKQMSTWQIA